MLRQGYLSTTTGQLWQHECRFGTAGKNIRRDSGAVNRAVRLEIIVLKLDDCFAVHAADSHRAMRADRGGGHLPGGMKATPESLAK